MSLRSLNQAAAAIAPAAELRPQDAAPSLSIAAALPPERVLGGAFLALIGNLIFSSSDAIVKLLTARYTVFEIIVFQASFALIPILVMTMRTGGLTRLRVNRPKLVVFRGLLGGIGTIFGFLSFSQLPLAETYSIAFCAPLLVTILSLPLLGERVGLHRWIAVGIGLAGILVMARPGFHQLHFGHFGAFLSAVTNACVIILMRRLARQEHHSVIVFAVIAGLIIVNLPGMLLTFRAPGLLDIAMFAATGILMGSAQFFIVKALSLAPAAVVAPMQYSQMIWALIYGALLFGSHVDPFVLAGAAIIIGSGLYIMRRERMRTVAAEAAATASAA